MFVLNVVSLAGLIAIGMSFARAQNENPPPPPVIGRWDLTVDDGSVKYPSWLEVTPSGYKTLVGQFVGRFGSARPVGEVLYTGNKLHFSIPVQWERRSSPMAFDATYADDKLTGTTTDDKGKTIRWLGVRAPALVRTSPPKWCKSVELFDGRDLKGWHAKEGTKHGWVVENGAMFNKKPGQDLVTYREFTDFKIHAEFRYPKGSNSGIYLRGRYEAQIEDNFGKPSESHGIGGIYGFLRPRINASKPAGEWQSYDLTLVGRTVTVVLNGELVIDRQEIPGITGGALNSAEGSPGPILVQGDHGQVEFRKFTVTTAM